MEQTQKQTASAQKTPGSQSEWQPILRLERVKKYYGNHGNITKAVDGISCISTEANLQLLWAQAAPERQHF